MNETHAEWNGEEENERVWHGEEEEEEEEGHLRGNVAAVTDESSVDKLRHQQVAKQHYVPVGFAEMVDNPKKKIPTVGKRNIEESSLPKLPVEANKTLNFLDLCCNMSQELASSSEGSPKKLSWIPGLQQSAEHFIKNRQREKNNLSTLWTVQQKEKKGAQTKHNEM